MDVSKIRIDGGTQTRAAINHFTVSEYANEMQAGQKFPPVVVFFDGAEYWLADGFHRTLATQQAKLPEIDADIRQGTRRDAILYSVGANSVHGLRRTNDDKRRAVQTLLNDDEWAKWSDREIARRCGVNHEMVGIQRKSSLAESASEEARVYTTKHGTPAVMNTSAIGSQNGSSPKTEYVPPVAAVESITREINTVVQARAAGFDVPMPSPEKHGLPSDTVIEISNDSLKPEINIMLPQFAPDKKINVHVSNNSGNNEWYTPGEYIAAALAVMGSIDLDPASSKVANKIVKAEKFFTAEQDGLSKSWAGNVWMNPPYAADLIGKFSQKLFDEVESGNVAQAIVLVNNATETAWFQLIGRIATNFCFPKGRVRFLDPEGNPSGAPLQGQAIIYIGKRPARFKAEFKDFGIVI